MKIIYFLPLFLIILSFSDCFAISNSSYDYEIYQKGDLYFADGNGLHQNYTSTDISILFTDIKSQISSGKIHVSSGIFYENHTSNISSNLSIQGNGMGITIIKAKTPGLFNMISIPNTSTNDLLSDFTIDGSAIMTSSPVKADGIWVQNGNENIQNIHLSNLEVKNNGMNGIEVLGSGVWTENNYVHDNYANGIYVVGISPIWAQYDFVTNNIAIDNSKGSINWDGIDIDPYSQFIQVNSNIVIQNDILVWGNDAPKTSQHITIQDNTVYNSPENGIDIGGHLYDVIISGNQIINPVYYGIVSNGAIWSGQIKDNSVIGSTRDGIFIGGTLFTNFEIENNHVENVGNSANNTYDGINLTSIASHGTVQGNKIIANSNMKWGIDSSNADTSIVLGNNVVDSGIAGKINSKVGQVLFDNN